MQRKWFAGFGRKSKFFGKGWGGSYNNLWFGAVLGHGASWSLVSGKGQGGSGWELVTLCARSAVADHMITSSCSYDFDDQTIVCLYDHMLIGSCTI